MSSSKLNCVEEMSKSQELPPSALSKDQQAKLKDNGHMEVLSDSSVTSQIRGSCWFSRERAVTHGKSSKDRISVLLEGKASPREGQIKVTETIFSRQVYILM